MPLPQLHRVRWAVRATLALGVAASVVANVLHAQPHPVSQAIAAWPPLALLLTVELISRVPVHSRSLAVTRFAATAAIAGIAAWVSYWHMAGVAARYGETGASPYLLPLSVDGLIVVASICLVELGGRITAARQERQHPVTAPAASPTTAGPAAKPTSATKPTPTGRPTSAAKPTPAAKPAARRPTRPATAGTPAPARPRRPVAETAALVAKLEASRPEATDADVASALGITTARLRAVRKQARELEPAA